MVHHGDHSGSVSSVGFRAEAKLCQLQRGKGLTGAGWAWLGEEWPQAGAQGEGGRGPSPDQERGQEPVAQVLILICRGRKCGPCSQPSWAPRGGPRPSGCSSQRSPAHPCLLPVRPMFPGRGCWEPVAAPGRGSGLGGLWVGWRRKCCTSVLFKGTMLRFLPLLWRCGRLGAGGSGGSVEACGGGPAPANLYTAWRELRADCGPQACPSSVSR